MLIYHFKTYWQNVPPESRHPPQSQARLPSSSTNTPAPRPRIRLDPPLLVRRTKLRYWEVRFDSFHLNGHTIGFYGRSRQLFLRIFTAHAIHFVMSCHVMY